MRRWAPTVVAALAARVWGCTTEVDAALPVGSDVAADTGGDAPVERVVTYEVSLTVDLGPDVPAGAHLSPALAVGQAPGAPFWALGEPASAALIPLVTHGASDALAAALPAGCEPAHGPGIPAASGVSLFTVNVRPDCPELTLAAMIGPSPDWFVGVSALPLHGADGWVDTLEVRLRIHDAGVQSGDALGPSSGATVPPAPIADRGREVGALRLRKLTSRCSELSALPPPSGALTGGAVAVQGNHPLRPVVTFDSAQEASGAVLFWAAGDEVARSAWGDAPTLQHAITLAGLRANTAYTALPVAWVGETLVAAPPIAFTTPPLPDGVPAYALEVNLGDVIDSFYRNVAHQGFTLVDHVGDDGVGYLLILDDAARVVWYEPVTAGEGTAPAFDWSAERTLTLAEPGRVRVLRPDGALQREAVVDLDIHSRVIADGPDRTLALVRERRDAALTPDGPAVSVVGDGVVALGADGAVQWRWSAFDVLDPVAEPFTEAQSDGSVRWLDASALSRDSAGDLLLALRLADQVVKVDRVTGELLWRLGGVASDFQIEPDAAFERPSDVADLGEGHLLVFDAGTAARGHSRVLEVIVDDDARTASAGWEYALPTAGPGSAVRTPNGNTLITSQPAALLLDVTGLGEVVWQSRGAGSALHHAVPVRLDACDPVPIPEAL